MKKIIDPFDYAKEITHALKKGILVTTKTGTQLNTMSISWGTMGIQWGLPIFTVFVRGCRHTSVMLEENPEFTINIPLGEVDKEIIRYCGTKSGRDVDKFQAMDLHTEDPEVISVPGIKELPLTLECKVIYKQQQYPECMTDPEPHTHYPENSQDIHGDYHTAYYGQIVAAYIIT